MFDRCGVVLGAGREEVYLQSFPTPGNNRQISASGSVQPRWRRDGHERLYLSPDQTDDGWLAAQLQCPLQLERW
jgi:hypothetical protein